MARKKNQVIWGIAWVSGPIGYKSQFDLLMLRGNWPERKIDSNSGYKKKDAWRLTQAAILFLAMNLMRSELSLVFF
jgi:hypothetical protein